MSLPELPSSRVWKRRASLMIRSSSLVVAGLLLQARVAAAQTLFLPADTAVDVGKYVNLDECVAAVARVQEQGWRLEREPVWKDTMAWSPKDAFVGQPEPLVTTAKRCSARFQAATLPVADFQLALPLFLVANRDADVATLVSRRLATLKTAGAGPASIDPVRMIVLDTIFDAYMNAKPPRFSTADSLVRAFDKSIPRPMTAKPAERLMGMYLQLAGKSQVLSDTTAMRKFGARTVAILDSLSPAERIALRENMDENAYNILAYSAAVATTGYGVMLDSLRRSTAAYLALQRALWVNSTGERPEASGFPIGRQAPVLVGAVGGRSSSGARPVPGKVNMLIFIDQACTDVLTMYERLNSPSYCRPLASSLRRVAALYPGLEITIVDRTHGSFMYTPPSTPEEESAMIQKALEAHQLPGTSVLGTTEYFRLPAPDRRRIEKKELPNVTPYSFGKSWPAEAGALFVIDQTGVIILASGGLTREFEPYLDAMLGVVLSRSSTSMGAGSPGQ